MATEEERNLAAVKVWEHAYNTDIEKFVDMYGEGFVVYLPIQGIKWDKETFRETERAALKNCPDRCLHVVQRFAVGDTVYLWVEYHFNKMSAGGETVMTPLNVHLKFKDGKIVRDDTYMVWESSLPDLQGDAAT